MYLLIFISLNVTSVPNHDYTVRFILVSASYRLQAHDDDDVRADGTLCVRYSDEQMAALRFRRRSNIDLFHTDLTPLQCDVL